jgi:RHS repeat-associated protein
MFTGGGLDNQGANGHAYSAALLNGTVTWNSLPFAIGAAGAMDVVAGGPQVTVTLPTGYDTTLSLLATAVNGYRTNQTFMVNYTDNTHDTFTQSLSDWLVPQSYAGESIALTMNHRNNANGTTDMQQVNLYSYSFAINPAKQVQSLTMPNNTNVVLLAATLTNGSWSPDNNTLPSNMIKVSANLYDAYGLGTSGVGDGNLTQTTAYPHGDWGTDSAYPPRVTQNFFDWRDRLVATKQGVMLQGAEDTSTHRPLFYYVLDNLGEVTSTKRYDADTWTVDTSGPVPVIPTGHLSAIRGQTDTNYDDQGRVYETLVHNVDLNGHVSTNTLNTNTWYNHRGMVIETAPPGGLVQKTVYDGAGRESVRYSTDGAGDSTWNDANSVTSNYVLTQTETQYDGNSNPVFMITRERFHSEMNPGPLGTTSTGHLARVSYMGRFYDAANRLTCEVNYGTNAGVVLSSRPANVPLPTDAPLVTAYAYTADTVQTVSIVGTPTSGSFQLNFNGQTSVAINFDAPLATVQGTLQGLLGAGNVQVIGRKKIGTAPAGPWEVRFTGIYAGKSVPLMTVSNTSLTVMVTATVSADDFQSVTLTGSPSGTFTLTFSTQTTMQTTAAIAYNAPASGPNSVESALAALSTIGLGNVKVTGPNGGPYMVHFTGTLAGTSQVQMTGTGTGFGVAVSTVYQTADAGRVQTTADPRSLLTKTDYDLLGRTVRTEEAYDGASPTAGTDKTTEWTYDGSNHILTLTADFFDGSLQQTQYDYGVSPTTSSFLCSNDLLVAVQYPRKNGPLAGLPDTDYTNDWDTYAYDALGEETIVSNDRNGSPHLFYYDVLGRMTQDWVTQFGMNNVDTTINKLTTAYDAYGNPCLFTSYKTADGSIANQVQRTFNGFGQLTAEAQYHGDPGIPTTPHGTVNYAYSFNLDDPLQAVNHSRLTSMTYPSGRVVDYGYNTTTTVPPDYAGLDGRISRLSFLADDSGGNPVTPHLEDETYLGLNTVVKRAHTFNTAVPPAGTDLTYLDSTGPGDGDPSDPYKGFDQFSRVVAQVWVSETSPTAYSDRFLYGYDRDSNRLYRDNRLYQDGLGNYTFGELYHANAVGTGYDNLNQMTDFYRGTLSATKDTIVGMPQHSQRWTLDTLGNWSSVNTDGNAQGRSFNAQNEATTVGSANLSYDNNGNTTVDDQGNAYVYDAWNRIVQVTVGGTGPGLRYSYDALGRRIQEPIDSSHIRDLYFSKDWQVLEERDNAMPATLVRSQYVWSPLYVDALVVRDRDPNGTGMFDERLYVQQDANWNVTAVVAGKNFGTTHTGDVVERYVEDPYGQVTFLDPVSWLKHGTGPNGSSSVGWAYLHQGGRFDTVSGLYNFRMRDYSPTLGRWMQIDPMGYLAEDPNLYRDLSGSPTNTTDPLGLLADDYPRLEKPRPLTPKEIADLQRVLPNFNPKDTSVLGEKDERHNCFAHACGLKGGRIDTQNPPPGSNIKKPRDDRMSGDYMDQIMNFYGYKKSQNCNSEPNKVKVAVYGYEFEGRDPATGGKRKEYKIIHAAVETGDGRWTSKLGDGLLIQHPDLKCLDGTPDGRGAYGNILFCYEKPSPGANKPKP